jgi:hypothetical protein
MTFMLTLPELVALALPFGVVATRFRPTLPELVALALPLPETSATTSSLTMPELVLVALALPIFGRRDKGTGYGPGIDGGSVPSRRSVVEGEARAGVCAGRGVVAGAAYELRISRQVRPQQDR